MALKYEAKAKVGTYTNQNGEEKPNWVRVGTVFETEKGMSMKIDAVPVGFDGWVSFFVPKPKDGSSPASANKNLADIDSDIPF